MTVHDFLYFDKQNEKKMFRSSKRRNIIFVISLLLGIASLVFGTHDLILKTIVQVKTSVT